MFGMFDQSSKCSINVRNVRSMFDMVSNKCWVCSVFVRSMFEMFDQCSKCSINVRNVRNVRSMFEMFDQSMFEIIMFDQCSKCSSNVRSMFDYVRVEPSLLGHVRTHRRSTRPHDSHDYRGLRSRTDTCTLHVPRRFLSLLLHYLACATKSVRPSTVF